MIRSRHAQPPPPPPLEIRTPIEGGTKAEQEMLEALEMQDAKDRRVPAKYLATLVFVYALAAVLILYGHTH